jgi:hypothetical protein
MKILQSQNPDIDTLKCPKCGAVWREKGFYDYDLGGWVYEDNLQGECPNDCRNWLGTRIKGKVIPRD